VIIDLYALLHLIVVLICAQNAKGRLAFLYYVNYLLKFYEFIDTAILVLRGKPTIFLHVYHHAATAVLVWSQLRAQSCMQWVVISINLLVHVIMYFYYLARALDIKIWWRSWLTALQIIQFVIDVAACAYAMTHRAMFENGFSGYVKCGGAWNESYFGIAILSSYLLLFISFYIQDRRQRSVAKMHKVD
jgi:GNS1/SUR4 family